MLAYSEEALVGFVQRGGTVEVELSENFLHCHLLGRVELDAWELQGK